MLPLRSASSVWRGSSTSRPSSRSAPPTATATATASAAATAALAAALTLASAAGPALAAAPAGPSPFRAVPNSPVAEGKKPLAFGPTADGSVRACEGNLNPNCVSTASTNDLYSPPWRAPLSVATATRALERAVPSADPTARLVQSAELPSGASYRAWRVEGTYGPDMFEVVVKPERSPRAGAASAAIDGPSVAAAAAAAAPAAAATTAAGGADGGGPPPPSLREEEVSALVTYRSSATTAKYLYPFQVVLTDGDRQRKRVMSIRAASNFSLVGCSYVECFDEGASSGDFPFSFRNDYSDE